MTAAISLDTQVDVSSTVYVELDYDDSVLSDVGLVANAPRTGSVMLTTSAALAVGEHSGSVSIWVCKTAACTEHYSSAPATLAYRVTITPAPPPATVTPTSVTTSVESGDPFEVAITVDLDASTNPSVYLAVVDSQGLFSTTPTWAQDGTRHFAVTLNGLPTGAPGTYTGKVGLLVCNASQCSTSSDLPGSPVWIDFTITVTPVVSLVPIPTITGLPEWETYQGNPAHTGYVPVTLDESVFTSGWTWASPFQYTSLSPVTTGSGLAVVSATGRFSPAYLVALNEADGTIAWQHDFGSIHHVNHPATSAGRVFVATSGHEETAMWSFELATGQQVFRTPFGAQWQTFLAPTFKDGAIYTNGGYYGGMYAFKGSSGVQRWFAQLEQYDLWSPAVDDTYAYAHTGYEWVAVNRSTGVQAFELPNSTFNWRGYALNIAPVIDAPGTIVVVDGVYDYSEQAANHLIRYSVSSRSELWRVDGRFASNPATANGHIYVLNQAPNGLDVYDAANGTKLWSWAAPEPVPVGNVIVTNDLVFARTTTATYAVDIATRQHVWSTPRTGALALSSNGVLYIVSPQSIDTYELL
jgi:outer membrane protein assembly factor BamB